MTTNQFNNTTHMAFYTNSVKPPTTSHGNASGNYRAISVLDNGNTSLLNTTQLLTNRHTSLGVQGTGSAAAGNRKSSPGKRLL